MTMNRTLLLITAITSATLCGILEVSAQACKRDGSVVTCEDGRQGILADTSIVWTDGTRSHSATPHPSVIIGNKSSVVIGPGVFAGNGKGGVVPMENPSAPSKARCPVLDGVSYCY